MRAVAIAAAGLLLSGAPSWAEGDQAVSLSVGYGTFSLPEEESNPRGTAVALDYELGFTDAVAGRASAGAGLYFGDARYAGSAVVGLVYHVDALDFRPYGTAGVGALVLGGGVIETTFHPLVEVGAGIDLLASRRLAYGIHARFESLLQRTSLFTASARLTLRWGDESSSSN